MRSFEEVREIVRQNTTGIMQRSMAKLGQDGVSEFDKNVANSVINECQNNLDNLDEVTTIEVGANTNRLINAMQEAYKMDVMNYYTNFERYIDEHVVGINSDGSMRNGLYSGQQYCMELGVGINDLMCFKGRNPFDSEAVDYFRSSVNDNYGTSIPMSGVEEHAMRNYEAVMFGDDEMAKAQAFVSLKEVQRDSGFLKAGSRYCLLANNKDYQDAKAICSTKSL